MRVSDEIYTGVVERFQGAALGACGWLDALSALAAATGARTAQLIGLSAQASASFNWMTDTPPEMPAAFAAVNGHRHDVNSRGRAGGRAPELTVLDETAFSTAEDCRRNPEYGELIRRYDLAYVCLSPLIHQDGTMIGMSVARGRAAGNISAEEKRLYAAVAPHARAAVRTQLAMESQGLNLLADVMEAVSTAAFICAADGRVRALSPAAERLAIEGRWLRMRGGRLSARHDTDTVQLLTALGAAAAARKGGGEPPRAFVVRDESGLDPLLVEVSAIPGEHAFRFDAVALLIARSPRGAEVRSAETARALYGLTATEAIVAAKLVSGLGPQAVAEQIGVSVGTVRSHIRRIFEKARVNSQLELVAAISARL